jgi:TetR/AcrR family transcriptional repressor of nem operon
VPAAADARTRILDAAEGLVMRRGFAATTVDAVLADAGASKGAFFHHFPSKARLGLALVERYAAADAETLDRAMRAAEEAHDDPAEQLVAFTAWFERAAGATAPEQPACLFVSFIYEAELAGAETDEVVAGAIRHWRERILAKLEAVASGRADLHDADLAALADHWFTIFEGAFLLAQATGDPTAVRRQLAHLRRYLELLFGIPAVGDSGG